MCTSATSGMGGRGGHPPQTHAWGATCCRARTMVTQEAPGGSNPPQLGWVFRRHFDRLGPIYFWSAAGLKIARGPQWPLNDRYSGRYKGGGVTFRNFPRK